MIRTLLVALLATAAIPAFADPAPLAELVKQVDIPYEQFTLPNGLRVVVHTDRKAPLVQVGVWYDVGSVDEPVGRSGFAHLFEHMMFQGSKNASKDYNFVVNGNLTVKGKTNPVSFPAKITAKNGVVTLESDKFSFDRQKFDVAYKSTMQDVLVKDDVDLKVKISVK